MTKGARCVPHTLQVSLPMTLAFLETLTEVGRAINWLYTRAETKRRRGSGDRKPRQGKGLGVRGKYTLCRSFMTSGAREEQKAALASVLDTEAKLFVSVTDASYVRH